LNPQPYIPDQISELDVEVYNRVTAHLLKNSTKRNSFTDATSGTGKRHLQSTTPLKNKENNKNNSNRRYE
jgi:hypothetical protein